MSTVESSTFFDFEIYVLGSMKFGMLPKRADIEAKLADYGLSLDGAESIANRVAQVLSDETSRFIELKALLGADNSAESVRCRSGLWPNFDFAASGDGAGRLVSIGYEHIRGRIPEINSPIDVPPWTTDLAGFEERFGPLILGHRSAPFENPLPAHEEYEFSWNGDQYGASFSWGIFLFSSKLWPED